MITVASVSLETFTTGESTIFVCFALKDNALLIGETSIVDKVLVDCIAEVILEYISAKFRNVGFIKGKYSVIGVFDWERVVSVVLLTRPL